MGRRALRAGGGEIALLDLAAALSYLDEAGAILAAVEPSEESLWVARALLGLAESGMLPIYVQAVEGRRRARVDMAYLSSEYPAEPWYRYAIILDASRHCELSPLCTTALGRGVAGVQGGRGAGPTRPHAWLEYTRTSRERRGKGETATCAEG